MEGTVLLSTMDFRHKLNRDSFKVIRKSSGKNLLHCLSLSEKLIYSVSVRMFLTESNRMLV